MTEQPAPAWNPPATAAPAVPSPVEHAGAMPPAAQFAPPQFAPPALAPTPAAAPSQFAPPQSAPSTPQFAPPTPQFAPPAATPAQFAPPATAVATAPAPSPAMPGPVVDGPVPAHALPQGLLPGSGSLSIVDDAVTFEPAANPAVSYDATAVALQHGDHPAAGSLPDAAPADGSPVLDARGAWWSPGFALVAATAALAWQMVATYARERLPLKLEGGEALVRFDSLVDRLPLVGGSIGQVFGFLLVAAAAGLLYVGWRRGVREPLLQGAIAVLALFALVGPMLLLRHAA